MNNFDKKQLNLLYYQFYGSVIFIITIIISTILTYNNILKLKNEKTLLNTTSEKFITLINRIILTLITIVFTYINYGFYLLSKQKKEATVQEEELLASILTLIAGFLLLDTTLKNINKRNEPENTNTPII